MTDTVVIIGGGHAAAQLCAALTEGGFAARLVLVSEEPHLPYHRPPLSKTLIKDAQATLAELKGASFYAHAGIEMRLGTRAVRIDRADTADAELAYDHLVIATGARARTLPGLEPGTQDMYTLRSYDDALRLREALSAAQQVMVLGGGFIGLEVAATARGLGKAVTVVEAAPRLLMRAVSPEVSEHLSATHRRAGIDLRIGRAPEHVHVESGRFTGVTLGGERLRADLLVIGIGATPDVELAQRAGLSCDNGIIVDELLATDDPHISAIGDCTSFSYAPWGGRLRLESVQNANDQAKTLAARLLGRPLPYAPVPWFWSDQGEVRLQIAGLWRAGYTPVLRAGAKPGSFSVMHYEGDTLRAVESINAPADHLAAKRWLQDKRSPDPAAVADPTRPLKEL